MITGYLYHGVHDKQQQCDEIAVWDWQREELGITDGTEKGMGIKSGSVLEGEWEWE